MAKPDLGEKRACPECGSKFYDLNKNPALCPKCGHSFDPALLDDTMPVPTVPLKPEMDTEDDEDMDAEEATDEEDIDEEESETKELELDGDDASIIAGSADDDEGRAPDFDNFSTDEDEDEDAALVDDDDDDDMPPTEDGDDPEEIEL